MFETVLYMTLGVVVGAGLGAMARGFTDDDADVETVPTYLVGGALVGGSFAAGFLIGRAF